MKVSVQKNHLGDHILYRNFGSSKKRRLSEYSRHLNGIFPGFFWVNDSNFEFQKFKFLLKWDKFSDFGT